MSDCIAESEFMLELEHLVPEYTFWGQKVAMWTMPGNLWTVSWVEEYSFVSLIMISDKTGFDVKLRGDATGSFGKILNAIEALPA